MFRPVLFLLLLAVLFLPGQLCAAPGELGDANGANPNPHNLSSLATHTGKPQALPPASGGTTEICVFCHTPHGATAKSTLWNRPDPARMGSFTVYNSVPLDGSGVFAIDDAGIVGTTKYGNNTSPEEYPNGASKLCLSCHDGVTSIGVLANGQVISMEAGANTITNPARFWDPLNPTAGRNFSKSHPVSFVYTQAVVDYINNSTTKIDVYSAPTNPSRAKLDGQNRMQCTTCHEPHFDTRGQGHTYPFWRNNDGTTNDTLDYENTCNQCHIPRTTTPHAL